MRMSCIYSARHKYSSTSILHRCTLQAHLAHCIGCNKRNGCQDYRFNCIWGKEYWSIQATLKITSTLLFS